jgi:hypothetical protein
VVVRLVRTLTDVMVKNKDNRQLIELQASPCRL